MLTQLLKKNMGRIDYFRLFAERIFFQGVKFHVCIPLDLDFFLLAVLFSFYTWLRISNMHHPTTELTKEVGNTSGEQSSKHYIVC